MSDKDKNELTVPLTTDEKYAISIVAESLGASSDDDLAAKAIRRGLELRTAGVVRERKGTVQALRSKKK